MKAILRHWNQFWFSRFDPISIGIFRIFLGFLILVMFVANFPNWERFYASDGIISLNDVDLALKRPAEDWWSVFAWTESIIPIKVFWWIGFFSALSFTVGWQTRLATITLYILQTSMIHRNLLIVNGEDLVFRMLLFYSCFAPLNYSLSMDSWIKKRRIGQKRISDKEDWPLIWPVRLMQVNIALIYLISVPYKLVDDSAWINGTAIYWTMESNMWSRGWFSSLFYNQVWITKLATYGTLVIEGAFPLLVWFRQTKLYAIAAIAFLHLGIAIIIPNVTFFTLAMVCSFWVFVPASSIHNLLQMLSISNQGYESRLATG